MNKQGFGVLVVALVLPLAFLSTVDSIEADSTALNTTCLVSSACPTPSVYYGVHVPGWLDNLDELIAFENAAKKQVSIVMWYQGWGLADGTQNFQPSWMNNVRNHGSIPMVTWEPWLYTEGITQTQFRLSEIISGTFDTYVTQWADDSKAWGHPYFLRFAAEMNGYWFPWSEQVNGNQPGEYVEAWRHVHDIFTEQGVTNVSWVWSPNVVFTGSIPLPDLYPGDDYVDWLGIDGYNWGTVPFTTTWKTFTETFSQTYTEITALSTKPLMIAEMASAEQGGIKSDWIIDAFFVQIPNNFERIKAFVWFNEDKERDWMIQSSTAAKNAFGAAIQSYYYATNQYACLCESPILIPSVAKLCCIYLPLVSK